METVRAHIEEAILSGPHEYLRDLSKRVRFYFLPVAALRRSNSLREHHGIVDAVSRRDEGDARDLVRTHVADTHDDAARAMAGSTGAWSISSSPAPCLMST
ncbi:MAG: FCD domain-containing protein [Pseudonocardiaceae bacterium]